MSPWPDSEFAKLPPVPASNDPVDIATFVDSRMFANRRAIVRLLTDHLDAKFEDLEVRIDGIKACMMRGFPNEDLQEHYNFHARQVASAKTMGKIRLHVMQSVIGAAVLGACASVGWWVVQGIADSIGKGFP